MTTIPAAPDPTWQFATPPAWPAPPGFDPRKGHVVDPTWAAAPEGWQFWVRPVIPAEARRRNWSGVPWWRVALGAAALLLAVSRFFTGGSSGADTGVGSCWSQDSGSKYVPVSCSDSSATYRVVSQVGSPDSCPQTSDSYLDSAVDGDSRYECLVPITH